MTRANDEPMAPLGRRELVGLDDSRLIELAGGQRLLPPVAAAFTQLQADAAVAGFDLSIASSYRSFWRQLAIFNGKASGERPIHDDEGRAVAAAELSAGEQLAAILRFSALPGTSRHHWGTDLDVFDAAALQGGAQVQLTPQEVAPGGVFDALHCWLDERIAVGDSYGFFRPYATDRGGVAKERWHLSYAPIALDCARSLSEQSLKQCWKEALIDKQLLLRDEIERDLPALLRRYVEIPEGWCPGANDSSRDNTT